MKVILASASPRRKELLKELVNDFEIIKSEMEEIITKDTPKEAVMELAFMKAKEVFDKVKESSDDIERLMVLGADTIVVIEGQIMGKPKDEEDAKNMIKKLQGTTHEVYTGVAVIIKDGIEVKRDVFSECTLVTVNEMSEDEIIQYVKTKEPLDKAGAYGIQGIFKKNISNIQGDYYNVVGLPLAEIWKRYKNEFI